MQYQKDSAYTCDKRHNWNLFVHKQQCKHRL